MSYLDILTYVEDTVAGQLLVKAAATFAKSHGSRLTGMFPRASYVDIYGATDGYGLAPAAAIQVLLQDYEDRFAKEADAARQMLASVGASTGIDIRWQEIEGDTDQVSVSLARLADLLIVPATTPRTFGVSRQSAAHLGILSGTPMLVLPDAGYDPDFGKSVLIAWKDSRESARAVKDALPLLLKAKTVKILSVSDGHEDASPARLQDFLARHGCKADIVFDHNTQDSVGDRVRLQAQMTSSDLIVMGMYGHSRMQEFVLGGVSREILANPPMPLFLSH
jgi:nucleotide-binding universal stress UspA family protein